MSTIATLTINQSGSSSLTDINTNFSNLNTDKAEKASPTFTGTVTLPTAISGVVTASSGVVSSTAIPSNANKFLDGTGAFSVPNKQQYCQVSFTSATLNITKQSFVKITGYSVVTDNGSNWSAANQWYNVPVAGTYQIVTKVRYIDNSVTNVSYGQGAHTSLADNTDFAWFVTSNATSSAVNRNGSVNVRISHFNANDKIFCETYWDYSSNGTVSDSSMSISLIAAD